MTHLKEWEAGWLAGIIDGEGCIGLYERQCESIDFNLRITIVMTCREAIIRVRKFAGCGNINIVNPQGIKSKIAYRWHASGKECLFVLRLVEPYLITKRPQMLLAIKYMETCFQKARYGIELALARELRNQFSILNGRGV